MLFLLSSRLLRESGSRLWTAAACCRFGRHSLLWRVLHFRLFIISFFQARVVCIVDAFFAQQQAAEGKRQQAAAVHSPKPTRRRPQRSDRI